MSAFIVSNTSLLRIRAFILTEFSRDGLMDQLGINGVDGVNQFIKDLARMNRYAIWCRYQERIRMPTLNFDRKVEVPTIYEMVKHVYCLGYQCSEGDCEAVHADTWRRLKDIEHSLEYLIVSSLPAYNEAAWA